MSTWLVAHATLCGRPKSNPGPQFRVAGGLDYCLAGICLPKAATKIDL